MVSFSTQKFTLSQKKSKKVYLKPKNKNSKILVIDPRAEIDKNWSKLNENITIPFSLI